MDIKFFKLSVMGAIISLMGLAPPVYAVLVDFDTTAAGVPYVGLSDSFGSSEYNGLGLTIVDSDPSTGSTYVNKTHPGNIGTAISGYYINVGAFVGITPTYVEFNFGPSVLDVAFDFASPTGAIQLLAYDTSNTEIFNGLTTGSDVFLNQAGFSMTSGHALINGVGPIIRVRLEAVDQALIIDNLNFTPTVPEPGTLLLLGIGLAGVALFKRKLLARLA